MKREIKNEGEYVEVSSDNILSRMSEIETSQILVITKARIELAGDDKESFIKRFKSLTESNSKEIENFSEEQKCDFLFRKMICENPYFIVAAPAPGG